VEAAAREHRSAASPRGMWSWAAARSRGPQISPRLIAAEPPSSSVASSTTTSAPLSATAMAALDPAIPPPTIATLPMT